ncbi:DNA repair protein RadA [Candidatus Microgenomates bacterium]|nr:DNA repair protein RadA [Candidatus Microgenomates bacterium]
MAKSLSNFVCQQCGYVSPSFLGRCPNCDSWNSLVEQTASSSKSNSTNKPNLTNSKVIKLSEVKAEATKRVSTGILELDQVLGGGIVPGMATLLAGEPGIGKSTILLQLAEKLGSVLYVAGEESASQIKVRADRLGLKLKDLIILEQTDADVVAGVIGQLKIVAVIIDSIQTVVTTDLSGTAGTVGQVRECAARIIAATKSRGLPLFLVGHVTKEGAIAGPKVLEHIVDTVLTVEGERYEGLRLIRASKNRFGATDEVGVFSMTDKGLVVVDPNWTNLSNMTNPGSCLTIAMEGTRPMLVEIQALVTSTPLPSPRRVASGVDYSRLLTIAAILQKRLNLPLYQQDIYVSVAGGLKLAEPAVDLAIGLAILSSFRNKALPAKTVAIGELDLLGNVRPVNSLEKRVKEAKTRGFKNILTAPNTLHKLSTF